MDLYKSTYYLIGQKLFTDFNTQLLVDWAMQLLQQGIETESVIILAGLDNADHEERERYFRKSLDELNIPLNKSDDELLELFIDNLTERVLAGEESAESGLQQMSGLARKTDYKPKYMPFYLLEEEIGSVKYHGEAIWSIGLNSDNSNEFILNEFKLLKKIRSGDFSDFENKFICNSCNNIMVARPLAIWQLKWPFYSEVLSCSACGSPHILPFASPEGKQKIMQRYD